MKTRLFLCAIALLSCCELVIADQLTLKNGDRLTGSVVRSDGKTLVVKTDLVGEVTIALADIRSLTTDKPVYVALGNGQTVSGLVTTKDETAEIKGSTGSVNFNRGDVVAIRSEAEQKVYESTLNPGWLEQWTGGADFGIALTRGNSNTTKMALGLALSRETRRDKTSVYAAGIYNREKTAGVSRTVANTVRLGGRYDRDFNRNWFGYGFTDLERNGQQNLNLRWVLGGGIGYHAIRNERTRLDLLGGLAMNREYFDGSNNDRTSLEAQVGQTLDHQFSSRVSWKEQLFIFPNLSEGGEYRINFDTSLVTDVTRRIGWHITLSDRYLSNPPSGFRQNDLLLTTGIKLKLGTTR